MESLLLISIVGFPLALFLIGKRNISIYFSIIPLCGALFGMFATLLIVLQEQPLQLLFYPIATDAYPELMTLGLRLDTLSALIVTTVMTIGGIVMRYSIRYLDDDPRRDLFLRNMASVLTCVVLMLLAQNLLVLIIAWTGSSYFLHQLLIHFPERPQAIKVAEQKFWISRFGDTCLIGASIIFLNLCGTLNFDGIFKVAAQNNNSYWLSLAAILIIIGAIVKSAQFPFHFWLPNSMESPTPVSALLHAGVINAGGYLVIRFSPLFIEIDSPLWILLLSSLITTVYGALIMITQNDIKRQLAYSTISQMGFMMLQCGLGAFHLATVHIIGHAFYKANAFLNSGTASDLAKLESKTEPHRNASDTVWLQFFAFVSSVSILISFIWISGVSYADKPGSIVLWAVLVLAMAQTVLSAKNHLRGFLYALLIGGAYFLSYEIFSSLLADTIPTPALEFTFIEVGSLVVCALSFFILYLIQNNLSRLTQSELGARCYVYLYNGGYLGK